MDNGYFMLSGAADESLRVKAFTSSSTGTRSTIRITLETDDLSAASWALRNLAAIQAEQKARAKAAAAKPGRSKMLALPPPDGS